MSLLSVSVLSRIRSVLPRTLSLTPHAFTPMCQFRTSTVALKTAMDKKEMMKSVPKSDLGLEGESYYTIDQTEIDKMLPSIETLNQLFDGVLFRELPICHIIVSKNNTKMTITDAIGKQFFWSSCGREGFKNCKRGTNVAAQALGISVGMKSLKAAITNIRVKISGIGPGRTAGIKGLEMSGLNIISITDITPTKELGPRPKKQRRV